MRDRAMMSRGNVERAALALCAALTLAACSTSPRTELSWDVREHKSANNTFYGPRTVTLPPVQQKSSAPTQAVTTQRLAAIPTPKPRKTPGWYTAPQPAPYTDNAAAPPQQYAQAASVRFRWPHRARLRQLLDRRAQRRHQHCGRARRRDPRRGRGHRQLLRQRAARLRQSRAHPARRRISHRLRPCRIDQRQPRRPCRRRAGDRDRGRHRRRLLAAAPFRDPPRQAPRRSQGAAAKGHRGGVELGALTVMARECGPPRCRLLCSFKKVIMARLVRATHGRFLARLP